MWSATTNSHPSQIHFTFSVLSFSITIVGHYQTLVLFFTLSILRSRRRNACHIIPTVDAFNDNRPGFLVAVIAVHVQNAGDHVGLQAVGVHGQARAVLVDPQAISNRGNQIHARPFLVQRLELAEHFLV